MSNFETPPLSRLVQVTNLRPDGLTIRVIPEPAELEAVALMLELPSIEALNGEFTLKPQKGGAVKLTGLIEAKLDQTCIVSLEPFAVVVREPVALEFAPEADFPQPKPVSAARLAEITTLAEGGQIDMDEPDPPDTIRNGQIDLGALTTEFLALGLDPFPRKPDAVFEFQAKIDPQENPFAALSKLKDRS